MAKAKYTRLWPKGHNFEERSTKVYSFPPLRVGEASRTCLFCGTEYVPKGRRQKYCCEKCGKLFRKKNGGTP